MYIAVQMLNCNTLDNCVYIYFYMKRVGYGDI